MNKVDGRKAGLIKFGTLEHMKAFYEKGEMYFNTFKFFKDLEAKGDGRADKNEYASLHYSGNGLDNYSIKMFPTGHPELAVDLNRKNGLLGLTIDFGNDKEYSHLYSMSYLDLEEIITNNLIIDMRNFAPTKDYAVVIYNHEVFIDRFIETIKKKYRCNCKCTTVEYVDKNSYCGEMGAFRKFTEFSYQNEYRIAVNFNTLEPQTIYIGSLADIAAPPLNMEGFYKQKVKIEHKDKNGNIINTTNITNESALKIINQQEEPRECMTQS